MRYFSDWFEHKLEKSMWNLDKSELIKLKRDCLQNTYIYSCNTIIFTIAMTYLITINMNAWGIAFGLMMLMWFNLVTESQKAVRWVNFVIYEKYKEEKI